METVVGIFRSRVDAEQARLQLHLRGVDNDKIAALSPGMNGQRASASNEALFVYKDALRRGDTVLMIAADTDEIADRVRDSLTQAGAESVDQEHEDYSLGLGGDAYRARYEGDLVRQGIHYRRRTT